jgi:hypothetical protein
VLAAINGKEILALRGYIKNYVQEFMKGELFMVIEVGNSHCTQYGGSIRNYTDVLGAG